MNRFLSKDGSPLDRRVPYSVDAEETLVVEGLPDGIEVVSDALLPQEAVNHQAVKISGPAGTRVAFDIPTAEEDKYTVQPFLAGGSGTSGIVLRENGIAIGEYLRLAEGKQRIEVVLTGESEGGGSSRSLSRLLCCRTLSRIRLRLASGRAVREFQEGGFRSGLSPRSRGFQTGCDV